MCNRKLLTVTEGLKGKQKGVKRKRVLITQMGQKISWIFLYIIILFMNGPDRECALIIQRFLCVIMDIITF